MSKDITGMLENYFLEYGLPFNKVEDSTWVLSDEVGNVENIVIRYEDPIIIFRIKLMEIPSENQTEFFKTLLTFNATKMVHGAYGIEGDSIVIIDTLEAENLDFNEFAGSIDAIILAITEDYKELKKFN